MALSLIHEVPLGNGFKLIAGVFTHTSGAAEETIVLGGARCYMLITSSQDSTGAHEVNPCKFTESVSGANNTVTFRWTAPVTAGKFVLLAKS